MNPAGVGFHGPPAEGESQTDTCTISPSLLIRTKQTVDILPWQAGWTR